MNFKGVIICALSAVMLQWTRKVSPDVSVRSFVMKLLIVVIVSVASMTLNAYRGLTELPPFSLDLMKSYAAGKTTVLLKLRAPNSIPFVFTSLKVSVPASVMAALVSVYFAEKVCGVCRMIRENILKAKLEILEGLQKEGRVVINNDNDLLHKWNEEQNKYKVETFGIKIKVKIWRKTFSIERMEVVIFLKTKK